MWFRLGKWEFECDGFVVMVVALFAASVLAIIFGPKP